MTRVSAVNPTKHRSSGSAGAISHQLERKLAALGSDHPPNTLHRVTAAGPAGDLTCWVSQVEAIGLRLRRLEFARAPSSTGASSTGAASTSAASTGAGPETLKRRAEQLAERLSYLQEPLALIELDGERGEAQVRSFPPRAEGRERAYFELALTGDGKVSLQRFLARHGKREAIDACVTRETLLRLVDDVVAWSPR